MCFAIGDRAAGRSRLRLRSGTVIAIDPQTAALLQQVAAAAAGL